MYGWWDVDYGESWLRALTYSLGGRMAAKTGDSDAGSLTPSEPSDGDDRSDRDSDYESDEEEE
jgi:hypothetical protein